LRPQCVGSLALDGSAISYGELKGRLEDEEGFSPIFTTRTGFVAGELMHKIQEIEPDAPLINVLVVNQKDRQPSSGAGGFMAYRFGKPRLDHKDAKQKYPELWERTFRRAAAEVYSYTEAQWSSLFTHVFGTQLGSEKIERDRKKRHEGTEKDGIPLGRKYGLRRRRSFS
jgi:hypothetical protein